MTAPFNSTTHPENTSCCRIYNGAISGGIGYHHFTSGPLYPSIYDSTTNTEYLEDDCLRLMRVKKVVVK